MNLIEAFTDDQREVADNSRLPVVSLFLVLWMGCLHLYGQFIPSSYFLFAPWSHSGQTHLLGNLALFIPLGMWTERRIGSLQFLLFTFVAGYLAIFLPVLFEYGNLPRGASGLTKALTAYAFVVLLTRFAQIRAKTDFNRAVAIQIVFYLIVLVLLLESMKSTLFRFFYLTSRPEGISTAAHLTGLFFGVGLFLYSRLFPELKQSIAERS